MLKKISVKRLQAGMHIHLKDLPWFSHPFFRSNFKIKKQSQINDLVNVGCEFVYYDPDKSDAHPMEVDSKVKPVKPATDHAAIKEKKASALRKRKEAYVQTEKNFFESAKEANRIMQGVLNGQVSFCDEAEKMAHSFADFFLSDVETTLNLINLSASDDEELYYHSLNVSILSCMLGKELELEDEEMKDLAFGALVHDIGKSKIPKRITYKKGPLTAPEYNLYKMHPLFGVGLLSGMKSVTRGVMRVVYHHHIYEDGKGYPAQIPYENLGLLPKIVSTTDIYDNLINKRDHTKSLTPHQALALMFKSYGKKLDDQILSVFIRMLGVYPPGSLCELDSGEIAMVVSIGENPLLPEVVICDLNVPKHEAMILRLGTDLDSRVERVLSPKELTKDQMNYLAPKAKIGYYADTKKNPKDN
ncbi:HD-GYP domain-containing protein [Maridesulfovibrio sp.]|uniref:HD-GYP domain-containing protein n=1 Tax=unclassified Maridesulfovibrio TaxID=2794999 RepID=UPI003B00AD1B